MKIFDLDAFNSSMLSYFTLKNLISFELCICGELEVFPISPAAQIP